MNRKSPIRQLLYTSAKLISRIEKKLERDIVSLLLIVLLATAFVLEIEVVFLELTIQIPLIILGGVLYGGYYYFIVATPKILTKKLRWKELQTRLALSVLSMSAIVSDVLIHDFKTPISYIKLWMAMWVVIGAEALVELLAFLKSRRNGSSKGGKNSHLDMRRAFSGSVNNKRNKRNKRFINNRGPVTGHKTNLKRRPINKSE